MVVDHLKKMPFICCLRIQSHFSSAWTVLSRSSSKWAPISSLLNHLDRFCHQCRKCFTHLSHRTCSYHNKTYHMSRNLICSLLVRVFSFLLDYSILLPSFSSSSSSVQLYVHSPRSDCNYYEISGFRFKMHTGGSMEKKSPLNRGKLNYQTKWNQANTFYLTASKYLVVYAIGSVPHVCTLYVCAHLFVISTVRTHKEHLTSPG